MKSLLCFVTLLISSQFASAQWIKQTVDTTASFRGLSVVSEKVVWASGTGGTVIQTIDGGKSWKVMQVADAAKLDFRDIEAFDANTAYILSIGNGESSRIYKTTDGGETWKLQFKNSNEKAFFDAIACWDEKHCIAMSDPIKGRYLFLSTFNGGKSWSSVSGLGLPSAADGEASFAASGTCLIVTAKPKAYMVSGGNAAHVFHSNDNVFSWSVSNTPIVSGSAGAGIFSIAMYDANSGVIVGGNYEKPNEINNNLAFTTDGGKTWNLGTGLSGYRSSVAYVDKTTIIAVGTNGSDISRDSGKTWRKIGDEDLNTVASKGKKATWAVGPKGFVGKFSAKLPYKQTPANNQIQSVLFNVNAVRKSKNEIVSADEVSIVNVSVSATDWDDNPHKYVYTVTAGKILGEGSNVQWNLTGVKPGKYTITVGISQPVDNQWVVIGKTDTQAVVIK